MVIMYTKIRLTKSTTGAKRLGGVGYGLEIPCNYVFYGDVEPSLPWLNPRLDYLGYSVQ